MAVMSESAPSDRQGRLEVARLPRDREVVQDGHAGTGGSSALDAVVAVRELLGANGDHDGVVGRVSVGEGVRVRAVILLHPGAAHSRAGVDTRTQVVGGL